MYQITTFRRIFELLRPCGVMVLIFSGGLSAAACGASAGDSAPANSQLTVQQMGKSVSDASLPASKHFRTLDEYLGYLEATQGPIDGPWYKQLSPDVFELQTGNLKLDQPTGAAEKRIFTRQELEKKFGFSK